MTISILIYIFGIIIIMLLVWVIYLEKRLRRLFRGTKAKDLEEIMVYLGKQVSDIKNSQIEVKKHLNIVDSRLDKTIRNVEMVRFNPFIDAGSNQSFAIAFINDEGDGVIMSSLYARDRMSVFAKPITKGKSTFELSTEEKEVLEKALK